MENLFQFGGSESTLADLDQGPDQIPDHPVKKAVPLEGQFQNTALFFDDPNGANGPHGRFALVSRVGGKGREVVFPGQNLSSFAQRGEIERAWDVPSPSDFQGVKRIGVGDPVKIGFFLWQRSGRENQVSRVGRRGLEPLQEDES